MDSGENLSNTGEEVRRIPEPHERLSLDVNVVNEIATVEAEGEMDPQTSPYAFETVRPLMEDDNIQKVVFSMNNVAFVDAAGLRFIADEHRHATEIDKVFELRDPSKSMMKLLEVTGLLEHVPVSQSDQ